MYDAERGYDALHESLRLMDKARDKANEALGFFIVAEEAEALSVTTEYSQALSHWDDRLHELMNDLLMPVLPETKVEAPV